MKINTKSSIKRKVIIASIAALIVVAGSVGAAAFNKVGPFAPAKKISSDTTVDLNKPTANQTNAGDAAKQATIENTDKGTATGSDPLPSPSPAATPGGKATVGMTITSVNQDAAALHIRSIIQTVTS